MDGGIRRQDESSTILLFCVDAEQTLPQHQDRYCHLRAEAFNAVRGLNGRARRRWRGGIITRTYARRAAAGGMARDAHLRRVQHQRVSVRRAHACCAHRLRIAASARADALARTAARSAMRIVRSRRYARTLTRASHWRLFIAAEHRVCAPRRGEI